MIDFWSTEAGRTAIRAARAQIRLAEFEVNGTADSVWGRDAADLLEHQLAKLSALLAEESARPSDEDVDRAADAAAGRLSETDKRRYAERLIATTLVISTEAPG